MSKYRRITRDVKDPLRKPPEHLLRFRCPHHGFLVDTLPGAQVWCPCGRQGKKEEGSCW